jgi:hypothetical protein
MGAMKSRFFTIEFPVVAKSPHKRSLRGFLSAIASSPTTKPLCAESNRPWFGVKFSCEGFLKLAGTQCYFGIITTSSFGMASSVAAL